MEGAADGGVTVPVASSGAGALGDDRIIDGDEKVDTKQHLAMLWMFIAFLVGTALKYMLALIAKKYKLKLPYSVVLLMVGGLLGYAEYKYNAPDAQFDPSSDMFYASQGRWTALYSEPSLLLFMFLPPLIFESAMSCNYFIFSSQAMGAILLAGPGMLLQVFLITVFLMTCLPYGWGITESIMIGATLSATDPVAVIALLKDLGVLPDLTVLIEGESILNDGTSIVVYELCYAVLFEPATNSEYIGRGIQLVVGGPVLGALMFAGTYVMLSYAKEPQEQTIITISAAYLCYFIAEATPVRVSGVLAVFVLGILMSAFRRSLITAEAEHTLHAIWAMLIQLSETLIFLLAGAIIIRRGFLSSSTVFASSSADYGWLFLLYFVLLLIRGFVVGVCGIYFRRYGHNLDTSTCTFPDFVKKLFVVTWGGLRGAVGLDLALSVNVDNKYRMVTNDPLFADRCLFYVAGIITLTLVVNATTLEWIIQRMGLMTVSHAEKEVYKGAVAYLEETYDEYMDELQMPHMHPEFITARWDYVRKMASRDVVDVRNMDSMRDAVEDGAEWSKVSNRGQDAEGQDAEGGEQRGTREKRVSIKLSAGNSDDDDVTFKCAADEDMANQARENLETLKNVKIIRHARYLMTLKVFYSLQHSKGLLGSMPYESLMTSIEEAIAFIGKNDSDIEDERSFELAWLKKSSLFRLADFMSSTQTWLHENFNSSWIDSSMDVWVRGLVKLQMLACQSLLGAHENAQVLTIGVTAKTDKLINTRTMDKDEGPTLADLSQRVCQSVEVILEELYAKHPDIVWALSTENASQVLLKGVQEDAKKLHELGQLSEVEFKELDVRFQNLIWNVRNHQPFGDTAAVTGWMHNVPIFNVLNDQSWADVLQKVKLSETIHREAGTILVSKGDDLEGLWYLTKGSVRAKCWDSSGRSLGDMPVYSGGIIGEIDVMMADATSKACKSTITVKCTTDVELIQIDLKQMLWIFSTFPEVRQRCWQLYGKRFLEMHSKRFRHFSLGIFESLRFGNAVLRRPHQFVSVKHKDVIIVIRGSVLLSEGATTSGFAILTPNPTAQETLTFTSKDTLVMLFRNENSREEHSHIPRLAIKVITKKSSRHGSFKAEMPTFLSKSFDEPEDQDEGEGSEGQAGQRVIGRTFSWKDYNTVERVTSSFSQRGALGGKVDNSADTGDSSVNDMSRAESGSAPSGIMNGGGNSLGSIREPERESMENVRETARGGKAASEPNVTASLTLVEPEGMPSLLPTGGLSASSVLPATLDDAGDEIQEVGCDNVAAQVAGAEGMANGQSPLQGPAPEQGGRGGVRRDEMC